MCTAQSLSEKSELGGSEGSMIFPFSSWSSILFILFILSKIPFQVDG
jgi:hypothetical protein